MTLDRAEALKEQCFKLCDEWRAWLTEAEAKAVNLIKPDIQKANKS
jgi:hypothetical protein